GRAITSSRENRLRRFISGIESDPISLFGPEKRAEARAGDWYGEHAGKWLIAASNALLQTRDPQLRSTIETVADYLVSTQEPDGYMGTYAPDGPRFTRAETEGTRTWDVWTHAYLLLGLLAAYRAIPKEAYKLAGDRIVALMRETFSGRPILSYGNHQGLSSLIVIHPLAEWSLEFGDSGAADLAESLLERSESLDPVGKLLRGEDVAAIGTGKIYQIEWLLEGLVALSRVTGRQDLLEAAKRGWSSIREHHLTLLGGPWGGIGRHKEVFNDPGYFSPFGMVETCSAMAWIGLNRALHAADPLTDYPEEIERTLLNTILGAADPNGEDWAYFTFPNGRRNPTYDWACCKSSGAIALEWAPLTFYRSIDGGIAIDGFGPSEAVIPRTNGEPIEVRQETRFPADSRIDVSLASSDKLGKIQVRIPRWTQAPSIEIDGVKGPVCIPGTYLDLDFSGQNRVRLRLDFPMPIKVHRAAHSIDHHGQEIVRDDYFALTRGPIVYAAGLLDGYKKAETLRAPHLNLESRFEDVEGSESALGPTIHLRLPDHSPIELKPYVEAGGRSQGTWRATWLGVAWQ
ncbi:MAG TPA: glycoside hydrolase family 127 protein, partial [Fimbriimonadaceae bacterium]|nr:glycoside hydrolase family 127 protein [Fimbriimonadaceae bacterium]